MPVSRCPQCNNPLTREEAGTACPACGQSLAGAVSAEAQRGGADVSYQAPADALCTRTKLAGFSVLAVGAGVIYLLRTGWFWRDVLTHRHFGIAAVAAGALGLWLAMTRGWPLRLDGARELRARLLCVWIIGALVGVLFTGSDFEGFVFRGTGIPVAFLGYFIIAACLLCVWFFGLGGWPFRRLG